MTACTSGVRAIVYNRESFSYDKCIRVYDKQRTRVFNNEQQANAHASMKDWDIVTFQGDFL